MEHGVTEILGFICGVVIGVGLIWIAGKLIKKIGGKVQFNWYKKGSYDERQLIARGQAYRAGFFTLLIYFTIASLLAETLELTVFLSFGGIWLGNCIALLVFAITCIIKDAYMSLYENPKGIIILFLIAAVINIAVGIGNILHGDKLIENGTILYNSVNLMIGVLFLIIVGVFCGKLIYDRRQENEE